MEAIENLEKNRRTLEHHVGSGGNAHAPATIKSNGFLTKEQLLMLLNASGKVTHKPNGTDVLTLDSGNYEISAATNNPINSTDTSIIEYHISTSVDGRRHIVAFRSSTGAMYSYVQHTGGKGTTATGGWVQYPTMTPIWLGNAQTGTLKFNFTLQDTFSLAIKWYSSTNQQGIAELSNGKSGSFSAFNLASDKDYIGFYELDFTADSNSLTITENSTKSIMSAGVMSNDEHNIYVTGIYVI